MTFDEWFDAQITVAKSIGMTNEEWSREAFMAGAEAEREKLGIEFLAHVAALVVEIREQCAKVCEDLNAYDEGSPGASFAAAIRAQSNASVTGDERAQRVRRPS